LFQNVPTQDIYATDAPLLFEIADTATITPMGSSEIRQPDSNP